MPLNGFIIMIHNSFKPQLVDVNIVHPEKVKKKCGQDLKRKDEAA